MTAILLFGFSSGIFAQDTEELRPEDHATGTRPAKNTVTVTHSDAKGIGAENGVMLRDPSDIIKVGNFYYVWYSKGTIFSGYDATIWYATSIDGHEWTEKGMALAKGGSGSWKTQEGDFMTNVAASLNAGAKGLRAAGYKGDVAVHIDRSWVEFYTGLIEKGYTDYQVVAISVYPKWGDSKTTVDQKIERMHPLAKEHKKKILVIETAAPYVNKGKHKTQDFDPELVVEVSPRGQALHLEKVCKLVLAIPEGRGLGVITWGSDLTTGIHKWDHVTWNRAQVTKERVALASLYVFGKYAKLAEPARRK